jgi:membrane protein YdbS with pleckstrin-like domain
VAISKDLLNEGESIVISTRTHIKALLLPALTLVVTAGAVSFLVAYVDVDALDYVFLAVGAVVFLWRVFWPFLRWLTTEYTLTNRRLVTRTGILTRKGHDIPLPRISDVASERGVIDRMLKCGTLVLSDASDKSVRLHDIPNVEATQLKIANLLHHGSEGEVPHLNDGT